MKILITGVGGPTPRSFAIALKKYSFYKRFELFGTDINPFAIGLYQNELFNETFVVPPATDPEYWNVIEKIIKEKCIEVAIILPEAEVLEWSKRNERGLITCKTLLPQYSLGELLVDKWKMTEVLKDMDIVPPSIHFTRDLKNIDTVFNFFSSAFWVRSSTGTSGLGSLKVKDADSLKNWIQINPKVNNFIASMYLPGRNLACKLLYYKGQLLRTATAERVEYIMSKVAPSGITGNTSFGRLLNQPHLVEKAKKVMDYLFKYTGASKHGFFTIDFKEDENGNAFITEINIRHVAFTQCFAAAGANFAEDTIRLLDDDESFNMNLIEYEFEKGLIFLRDVDSLPVLMKENELLKVCK